MKIRILKESSDGEDCKDSETIHLDETSGAGGSGGSMEGYAGSPIGKEKDVKEFNEEEKKIQKLKGKRLAEMFSSSTQTGGIRISVVSAEKEHAGHIERSKHQGLKNVMNEE